MNNDAYTLPPTLRTTRLLLRPVTPDDAADVFAYAADPLVTRYVSWPAHRTIEDSHDFVSRTAAGYGDGPVLHWAIMHAAEGRMIGTCGINRVNDQHFSCEVGYVLARPCWGKGLMTEALRTVLDALFRFTPLNRVEGYCLSQNGASARVMEKSGMTFEGIRREGHYVKDAFRDERVYAMLRKDWLAATRR